MSSSILILPASRIEINSDLPSTLCNPHNCAQILKEIESTHPRFVLSPIAISSRWFQTWDGKASSTDRFLTSDCFVAWCLFEWGLVRKKASHSSTLPISKVFSTVGWRFKKGFIVSSRFLSLSLPSSNHTFYWVYCPLLFTKQEIPLSESDANTKYPMEYSVECVEIKSIDESIRATIGVIYTTRCGIYFT